MTRKNWKDIKAQKPSDVTAYARARREQEAALSLAELRRARNLTQHQLAESLGMKQSAISRLEHQTDVYLSTLRAFVEALGGRLELSAVFTDSIVPIRALEDLDEPAEVTDDENAMVASR